MPGNANTPTDQDAHKANAQWGGRFAGGPAAIIQDIKATIGFDKALWRQDIAGSNAHAAMLAKSIPPQQETFWCQPHFTTMTEKETKSQSPADQISKIVTHDGTDHAC